MRNQFIRMYYVKMPSDLKGKWFSDKDTAVFFAQCLYNNAPIIMNRSPIFEHKINISPDGLEKFLNKQEV